MRSTGVSSPAAVASEGDVEPGVSPRPVPSIPTCRMGPGLIVVVCTVVGVAVVGGCGSGGERSGSDVAPDSEERPSGAAIVLDWRAGTYEGIRLGDRSSTVTGALGTPKLIGRHVRFVPFGENFYDIGGLTNFRSPRAGGSAGSRVMQYRRRVLRLSGGRVTALGTTDPDAVTPEGAAIGDDQQLVRDHYPRANCFVANEGTKYRHYPICTIRVCDGRLLAFGEDPIASMWLAAETRRAVKRCTPP
jgi:hypothetical protein